MANELKRPPGRPTIPKEQKRIGFSLYLKAEVLAAIEAEAIASGTRAQTLLRDHVESWALKLIEKQRAAAALVAPAPEAPAAEEEMAV